MCNLDPTTTWTFYFPNPINALHAILFSNSSFISKRVNTLLLFFVSKNGLSPAFYHSTLSFSSPNLLRCVFSNIYYGKQVQLYSMARHFIWCWNLTAFHHRLHPPTRRVKHTCNTNLLVRPLMGSYFLFPGLHRQVLLRHRWLRLIHFRMLWWWSSTTCYSSRVHSKRSWWTRLLWRQPGGRL